LEFGVLRVWALKLIYMENREFGKKLEQRTKAFAIRIVRLSALLPNSVEGKIIRNQMTKSGTSIAANYREATRARSRADFKNKIKICESESNETCYWLEIISELEWSDPEKVESDLTESNELLAIFTSIGKNLKL